MLQRASLLNFLCLAMQYWSSWFFLCVKSQSQFRGYSAFFLSMAEEGTEFVEVEEKVEHEEIQRFELCWAG